MCDDSKIGAARVCNDTDTDGTNNAAAANTTATNANGNMTALPRFIPTQQPKKIPKTWMPTQMPTAWSTSFPFATTGDMKIDTGSLCIQGDPNMACKDSNKKASGSKGRGGTGGDGGDDDDSSSGLGITMLALIILAGIVISVVIMFLAFNFVKIKKAQAVQNHGGFNNPMYHMDAPDPNNGAHDDTSAYQEIPFDSSTSSSQLFPLADRTHSADSTYQELPLNSPTGSGSGEKSLYHDIAPNPPTDTAPLAYNIRTNSKSSTNTRPDSAQSGQVSSWSRHSAPSASTQVSSKQVLCPCFHVPVSMSLFECGAMRCHQHRHQHRAAVV